MSTDGAIVKSLETAAAPLLTEGAPMVERAATFIVVDAGSYRRAGEMALAVKRVGDAIYELFDEPCKDAHTLHRKLTTRRGKMHGPFKMSYNLLMGKAGNWKNEDDARVRREQEAVERTRREAEEKLRKQAEELRQAGMPAAAEAMIVEAPPPPARVVRSEVPAVKGISHSKVWKARIVDPMKVKRAYLLVNEPLIRDTAKRMGKLAEAEIGGIVVYEDTRTSGRTG